MIDAELDDWFERLTIRAIRSIAVARNSKWTLEHPESGEGIAVVLKGESHLDCAGRRHLIRPGSIVIVPTPALSQSSATTLTGRDAPAASVDHGSSLAGLAKSHLVMVSAEICRPSKVRSPFDQAAAPLVATLPDVLRSVLVIASSELAMPGPGSGSLLAAMLKQVLIISLRGEERKTGRLKTYRAEAKLRELAKQILEHPHELYSLRSLASQAGMGRTKFVQQFTMHVGSSPMAFVQAVRLDRAANLLRTSDAPVKSIAAAVGFASRSHFSSAFGMRFGTDPTNFRRKGNGTATAPAEQMAGSDADGLAPPSSN